MRYIKLEDNKPVNYALDNLFGEKPDADIYKNSALPNEELLAQYNIYPLITTDPPQVNEDSIAEEGLPELKDGRWYQTWNIRKLSQQEIQEMMYERNKSYEDMRLSESQEMPEGASSFFADSETQKNRYEICQGCPSFTLLKTCKECGCVMPLKIKLKEAFCPLDKW